MTRSTTHAAWSAGFGDTCGEHPQGHVTLTSRRNPMKTPSVGRSVHVSDVVAKCQAGIVTDVAEGTGIINVAYFRKGGTPASATSVPFSAEHWDPTQARTSYHWPEYVAETPD